MIPHESPGREAAPSILTGKGLVLSDPRGVGYYHPVTVDRQRLILTSLTRDHEEVILLFAAHLAWAFTLYLPGLRQTWQALVERLQRE